MLVKVKIDTRQDWTSLYWGLKKAGLLERVSINDVTLPMKVQFPIEIPIDIDGVLALAKSPVAKTYKKMIDFTLTEQIKKVKTEMV